MEKNKKKPIWTRVNAGNVQDYLAFVEEFLSQPACGVRTKPKKANPNG